MEPLFGPVDHRNGRRLMRRFAMRFSLAHACMIVAGLVTFISVSSALRERNEMRSVAVASHDIAAGTTLDAAAIGTQFEIVMVRADSELLRGVTDPAVMPSGQLSRSLAEGEPLRSTDIVPVSAGRIERTFAIAVDDVTLIGLGLQVGDVVDVIGVVEDGALGYIVAGARIARLPGGSEVGGAFAVRQDSYLTIEVSDGDALSLASALRAGDVEIVRSTGAGAPTHG